MYPGENIKIGARILTEKQATVLLPNYLKINNQINQFREEAKKFNKSLESMKVDDYQRYEMYSNFDNVISILGERGSGKTSVFLTLKDVHDSEYKNQDITLPLIVPDNMGEISDALGWIISYLEKYVNELHPDLKIRERKNIAYNGLNKCIENEDSELKVRFKKLRKTYEIRKEVYLNKILKRDEGTKEYINDKARMTQADQSLIVDFNNFVNSLVMAKKEINYDKEIEPLILIFFDDVDISAHRCPEVLETIRNYLNHPNIVVFVSGDFKVFSEIMCLEFLRKEGVKSDDYYKVFIPTQQLQDKEINLFSALELRKDRSQEYLKKVLPPSFRFYMKKLNDRDKSNFSYEFVEGSKSNGPTLSELLSKIENKGNKFIWGMKDNEGDFLINNEKIPYAFFEIFDDNPRGLINPYYYLYQKVYLSKNQKWDISDINHFLQIILNSSVKLQKHKETIENIIVINETSQVTNQSEFLVYINYDLFLDVFLQEFLNNKEESLIIEEFTTLYILCLFFEKLIKLVIPNYSNYSSGNLLSRILNHKTENLFPNIENDELLLRMYSAFDNKVPLNSNKIFSEDNKGTKRLEQIYFETLNRSVVANTYNYNIESYDIESYDIEGYDIANINLIHLFELVFQKDENWVSNKIVFIKNNGKSYRDIYYDVFDLVSSRLSFLDKLERIGSISDYMPNNLLLNEEELVYQLYEEFEKLQETYSGFEGMLQIEMKRFIKSGLNLEKLLQRNDSLSNNLNNIEDRITLIINQVKVTEDELKNIKNQERLIKTRKKMLNKIKELEAFTQNELRKEEWELYKNSFVIARESSQGTWVDENGIETYQEPVLVFDPKDASIEYEKLIQENLDGLTKVGMIVKDKHVLTRQDIVKFIEKYFIEEQESLLLRAHLPLDIEGRRKQIKDLNNEIDLLTKEINRVQLEQDSVERQINNIYQHYNFEGSDFTELSSVLQRSFKDYLLSSIYQQTKGILGYKDRNVKLETDELLEILKVYEESIEEAKNFLSDNKQFEDLERASHEESLYKTLDKDDIAMLLSLSQRGFGHQFRQYVSPLHEKGVRELHIDSISEIIKELGRYLDTNFESLTLRSRRGITELIKNLENHINKPSNGFKDKNEFLRITLPALNNIIMPYMYIRVLVEDRRINEETATVYFRKLKKELADFMFLERSKKKQTRFVRFLEKTLIVE
ncbi:coiled-coil domain-containing protein [Bacillus wiedmannii]|uniref:coiled-coil domain-containing protein n=1 Tax=Bacillus wiedmannii TaxID=1890302 RepID=UPI000D1588EF|nr:hypothetical protein [Bacillus wiedmannii]PTC13854.1 hypothetical protein C6557_08780 [Bacillus wiedmannii]